MPSVFHTRVILAVVNLEDVRVSARRSEGKSVEISELPAESDLLILAEVLVPKEHHLALEQRVANELGLIGDVRLREIDAVDHAAHGDAQVLEFEAEFFGAGLQGLGDRTVSHPLVFERDTEAGPVLPRK